MPPADRMIRHGTRSMRSQRWLLLLSGLLLSACDLGPLNPDTVMYVRVPPQDSEKFTASLASLLKEEGISASVARTIEPFPSTNHVLEGTNWSVRVWAQNAVLDPEEGKACGYPPLGPVEQTQYLVSVQRRSPMSKSRAREMFARLKTKLLERGYKITPRQTPCEPLSKPSAT